jgi:Cft2 family RNA processing exonuclease
MPSEMPQSPSILITDARHATTTKTVNRKERDRVFLDKIMETLRRGGSVLLPADPSG